MTQRFISGRARAISNRGSKRPSLPRFKRGWRLTGPLPRLHFLDAGQRAYDSDHTHPERTYRTLFVT